MVPRLPLSLLFTLLLLAKLAAQQSDMPSQLPYARSIIDTLASPAMHGRGYVNKGDKIAATWISNEFKKLGLLSFNKSGSYEQPFSFPVNTFPGRVEMTFYWKDGRKETSDPGEHFIVRSASPSVKGRFPVVRFDSAVVSTEASLKAFLNQNLKKSFVLVDTTGVRDKTKRDLLLNYVRFPRNVKGILVPVQLNVMHEHEGESCTKLNPWDFSQTQSLIPVIEIEAAWKTVHEIDVAIGAKFIRNYTSQNVLGYIRGSVHPDSFIVFTAHYDHLGRMGQKVYFPGANDNASGVAMLLCLAKHYSQAANKPRCSIVFIAFGAEEVGLLGSAWFNRHPVFPMNAIRFLVNMDILGTGDDGITVVNATLFDEEFMLLQKLNAQRSLLPQIKARGKASISDHFFFTERGVPCFYIYTLGGIKAYHDTCDRRETLPLTKFDELFVLLTDFTSVLDAPSGM
jgi:aminopeptidase YwaD